MRLLNVTKLIQQLLAECVKGAKKSINYFNKYITIFDLKPENIILELKKQSFALANEGSDHEDSEEKEEGGGAGANAKAAGDQAPSPPAVEELLDSAPGSEDEDDSDEEGGGGNYQ